MKRGYKQTEIGVIPEDWKVSKIETIIDEISMGPFGSDITVANYVSAGVPVLNGANVASGRLIDSFKNYVSFSKAKSLKKAVARRGDIVVTHRGTIGQISYIPNDSAFECYVISQSQFRVRFTNDAVIPAWVVLYFHSGRGSKSLLEGKGHTGVPAIAQPTRTFRNLNIPVPSLPEQHAIAEALSDVDVLIDTLDRLIAKKRDLKQAAMQQLLTGLTRLPGFYGDWEVKRLGNIATCFSGGTPATEVAAYYGGDIPWITSGDLNKEYITDVAGRISQAGLMNSAAQMVEANTLLIALYGATSGVTAISRIRAAINQAVLAIVPHQDDTSFLYFRLRLLKDWLISTYTQGGQPNLSGNIIKSVELSLPPLPEQTAIATVLGELDSELAELEQRREKILAVKLGMMQELLTGRTRLV